MDFKELEGERYLSGVDEVIQEIEKYGYKEDVNIVRFVIDGITYKAIEDPDDGYRSYLSDLETSNETVSNIFEPHKVIVKVKEGEDIIEFTDSVTNKVVLEIGTDTSCDYYPFCVMYWRPENLACNIGK